MRDFLFNLKKYHPNSDMARLQALMLALLFVAVVAALMGVVSLAAMIKQRHIQQPHVLREF